MIKNYIISFLLTLICGFSEAQITVTNMTFPSIGDNLKTSTDLQFSNFDATVSGPDQTWDFTDLVDMNTITESYINPSEGAHADSFPDANLLLVGSGGVDTYYKVTENVVSEIGRIGIDPIFEAVTYDVRIDGDAILRKAPINYGDTFEEAYNFGFEIPVSALPDTIVSLFDFGLFTPTDIRVQIDVAIDEIVDSWGMISIPIGDYDVLRIKRETTNSTSVQLKVFGQWVDLSDVPIELPDFVSELITARTVTSYAFLSDTEKEEIAEVTVDSIGTPISTTFKAAEILDNTVNTNYSNSDVMAYPNPSYGDVRFQFNDMPADRYRIDVLDILGKKVWSKTSRLGATYLDTDMSELRTGTYLYRVFDSRGRKLTTKRLMIVRP